MRNVEAEIREPPGRTRSWSSARTTIPCRVVPAPTTTRPVVARAGPHRASAPRAIAGHPSPPAPFASSGSSTRSLRSSRRSDMGSLRYAARARERGEQIVAMISVESIGYYADAPGSQQYPFPFNLFYPSTGDFIAFVANVGSRSLLHQAMRSFRAHARLPSEGAAAPACDRGHRLVGSLGVLAARLSRDHGHRHGAVQEPALPYGGGYA